MFEYMLVVFKILHCRVAHFHRRDPSRFSTYFWPSILTPAGKVRSVAKVMSRDPVGSQTAGPFIV